MQLSEMIKGAAPMLASMLGGPFAEMATQMIATAVGTDTKDHASIANLIASVPENLAKVKDLEEQNKISLLALQLKDADSAREMASSTAPSRYLAPFFVVAIILALILSVFVIYINEDRDVDHAIMLLFPVLLQGLYQAIKFTFGTFDKKD